MKTQAFGTVNPLHIDHEILALMKNQGHNPHPGNPAYLAILNEEGQAYRVICAHGLTEAIRADKHLIGLGLNSRKAISNAYLEVDRLTGLPWQSRWNDVFQIGDTAHPLPRFDSLGLS